MKQVIFSALIATSLLACQSAPKPAFDVASAKKEIAEANLAFETAVSKSDSIGIASLYTTDAKWMNPNAPSVEGKAALVSSIAQVLNAGIGAAKLNTTEVWGDENYVTEEGNYKLFAKDGSEIDKGKYIVLWKRVDGKLMFHRDIFNSDLPVATK
ncbi:MAG: YybH family protein [Sediminibacterium sp.]